MAHAAEDMIPSVVSLLCAVFLCVDRMHIWISERALLLLNDVVRGHKGCVSDVLIRRQSRSFHLWISAGDRGQRPPRTFLSQGTQVADHAGPGESCASRPHGAS